MKPALPGMFNTVMHTRERNRSLISYVYIFLTVTFLWGYTYTYAGYIITFITPGDPFEEAEGIPANVRLYVCVLDGASLLSSIENSSLARGLLSIYTSSNTERVWDEITKQARSDPDLLFKQLLGKRFVLIKFQDDSGVSDAFGDKSDNHSQEYVIDPEQEETEAWFNNWIIITDVKQIIAQRFITALEARVQQVIDGTAFYVSSDGTLALSYRNDRLYVADALMQDQLVKVVRTDYEKSLADISQFQISTQDLTGNIGIYYNSNTSDMSNNWRVLALSLGDEFVNVVVREPGLENDRDSQQPKQQQQSQIIDSGIPDAMTSKSIITDMLSNKRLPHGYYYGLSKSDYNNSNNVYLRVDNYSHSDYLYRNAFGLGYLLYKTDANLFNYVGPAAFTLIDTVRVKEDHETVSSNDNYNLGPVIHWGFQVQDVYNTAKRMDKVMKCMLTSISTGMDGDSNGEIIVPESFPHDPKDIRAVDIGPWITGLDDLPGSDSIELVWSTVTNAYNPNQSWWICSTNRYSHKKIAARLSATDISDKLIRQDLNENIISYGYISPHSAVQMLSTWSVVNKSTDHPIYSGIFTIGELLSGLETFDWIIHKKNSNKDKSETYYIEKIYQARYSR